RANRAAGLRSKHFPARSSSFQLEGGTATARSLGHNVGLPAVSLIAICAVGRGKRGALPKLEPGNRRRHAGLPMASDRLQPGSAPPKAELAGRRIVVAGGYPEPACPPRALENCLD